MKLIAIWMPKREIYSYIKEKMIYFADRFVGNQLQLWLTVSGQLIFTGLRLLQTNIIEWFGVMT